MWKLIFLSPNKKYWTDSSARDFKTRKLAREYKKYPSMQWTKYRVVRSDFNTESLNHGR